MAHHIYQTEGYILGRSPIGEASGFFRVYTKDLGLIHATAQGVRLLKSKLRYSLQEYSFSKLSLVRGKEMWRITNAREEFSLFVLFRDRPAVLQVSLRLLIMLERLIQGEEKHEALFEDIHQALLFLRDNQVTDQEAALVEPIIVLKMLDRLGYGSESGELKKFVTDPLNRELISAMASKESAAQAHIKRSLGESHL